MPMSKEVTAEIFAPGLVKVGLSKSHGAAKARNGLPITQANQASGLVGRGDQDSRPLCLRHDLEGFPGCRKKHLTELCHQRPGPQPQDRLLTRAPGVSLTYKIRRLQNPERTNP